MKTEIEKYLPCQEALDFRKQFKTFEEAWKVCSRGDWMLWIAKKVGVNKRELTLAKGYCANTVIHLMKDKRSRDAVKAAIKYGKGLIEDVELDDAAADAAAADDAAADDAAAYDAYAAAAYAAAADAAAAYDAAAYAAAAYAADDAKKTNQLKTAKICRKYLTKSVFELINTSSK